MQKTLRPLLGAALAAGLWTGSAQSQTATEHDPQAQSQSEANAPDRPAQLPDTPVSIPFELRDNLVVIDVTLNGRRQSAVVDSGSGALLVDRRTTAALGLVPAQSIGEVAGGGAQAQQLQPIELASLQVGPLGFAKLPGYASNL
uniref:aspartyl protease family protein n=1 Tax=Sphingomonas sp. TaxID=28214 RepID=UPI003B3BD637